MDTPASSGERLSEIRTWLGQGHRRMYALALAAAVVTVVLVSVLSSGGVVSIAKMQQLIDTAYETSGTHCVPAAHGRDLCHLKAERCEGTLLVAASSEGHFTIVSSTPEQLDSSACVKSERGIGGFE